MSSPGIRNMTDLTSRRANLASNLVSKPRSQGICRSQVFYFQFSIREKLSTGITVQGFTYGEKKKWIFFFFESPDRIKRFLETRNAHRYPEVGAGDPLSSTAKMLQVVTTTAIATILLA